jgi:hypothetical protein
MVKSPKVLVSGAVLLGLIAAGIYYQKKRAANKEEQLAELAEIRSCGSQTSDPKTESAVLRKWFANENDLQSEGKSAFIRNMSALPSQVVKTLEARGIRFALESPRSALICTPSGAPTGSGLRLSCLKSIPSFGEVMIVGADPGVGADGKPLPVNEREIIDGRTLPLVFWSLFEHIWNTAEEFDILDEKVRSRSNSFSRLKRYVSEALTIGPGEQEYYRREFGGAGTKSPAFETRAVVLLASNLYCDADTYARLSKQQPEAVKRFMSTFGCAMGKPWHLAETDFKTHCAM